MRGLPQSISPPVAAKLGVWSFFPVPSTTGERNGIKQRENARVERLQTTVAGCDAVLDSSATGVAK